MPYDAPPCTSCLDDPSVAEPSAPAPPPSSTAGPVLPLVRRDDLAVRADCLGTDGPAMGRCELYAVVELDMLDYGCSVLSVIGAAQEKGFGYRRVDEGRLGRERCPRKLIGRVKEE